MEEKEDIIPIQNIIYEIRGLRVMIDSDLAKLYGVETKNFNRAVKRNINKFPPEFMFQLTKEEWQTLRCQIGTFKNDIRKFLPYVFTEHGVLMSANVLNSEKANAVSIEIIKVFVNLRNYAISQVGLGTQIEDLRKMLLLHIENTDNRFSEHDKKISQIIQALNELIEKPTKKRQIGFTAENK
jgi:hypothetical protein